jgi:HEAT repeat protein
MAFIKSDMVYETRVFRTFLEAQEVFENIELDINDRVEALTYLLNHKEISYILDTLFSQYNIKDNIDFSLIDHAFANFAVKPRRDDDYNSILKMLDSKNAYLRNKAITFLQDSGEDAKKFLINLLQNKDRDIRIFAVNVLGDVKYEDSRDILMESIQNEDDINVLMTSIDYIGEIGKKEDIPILEKLKDKFPTEPYVAFGINIAIEKIEA